jgi:heat shock protein HtpX
MAFLKRVFFFLALNFAVTITFYILLNLAAAFGFQLPSGYYSGTLAFCMIYGMFSAFVSLLISRWAAKKFMGVQIIDPNTRDPNARELLQTVHQLARKAGISVMPEVGIYNSPEVNAFATGPTRNRSLVAVSAGLLQRMRGPEVEGVLGHEVAHIANGDMVTMTLLQGVVNGFVMFFAKIVASVISEQVREENRRMVYFISEMVLYIAFMILGSIVIAAFSRWREYRADQGGARLAGRDKMISALRALKAASQIPDPRQEAVAALKISSSVGMAALFMTHPPLEKRILALERGAL